jgi:putative transposase
VARSSIAAKTSVAPRRRGRLPQPEAELLAEIRQVIAVPPTYGYRRVHALIRRCRRADGGAPVNVKRVYQVMKAHALLLQRHTGDGVGQRHDRRVAVDWPDRRWCSDGFEIGCGNGERVRIAFTLVAVRQRLVIRSALPTGGASPASRTARKAGKCSPSPTYPQAPPPTMDSILMK